MRAARVFVVAVLVGAWFAPALAQTETAVLAQCVADGARDERERVEALGALQDRGALEVPVALAALRAGGELTEVAAAIVRHEWVEVPGELLEGVAEHPAALGVFLRELALAPRPSLAAWVAAQAERKELRVGLRCLALAACGRQLTRKQAVLLVDAARAELESEDGYLVEGDDYRTALWLLEPGVADGLLGRLHGLLMRHDVDPSKLTPFFDRLSEKGLEQLLGLVAALSPEAKAQLGRYFRKRQLPAYRARVEAALDGRIPLEPIWLLGTGGSVGERARVDRLLAVLADDDADATLRELVFETLVGAHVFDAPVLAWAEQAPARERRIRRLLREGITRLEAPVLAAWLADGGQVALATAAALPRRTVLEPELERIMVEAIDVPIMDGVARAYAFALLQRGSAAGIAKVWPFLRASTPFPEFAAALARRREPWVHEQLLEELVRDDAETAPAQRERQLDAVRLALIALGDRRELEQLVAAAGRTSPVFVRRCASHQPVLPAPLAVRLLDDAVGVEDEDLAAEMVAWAALATGEEVQKRLTAFWEDDPFDERHLAAVRGLALGARREQFVTALRAALTKGELDDRHDALGYELIATMPAEPGREDLELLAEVAILAPLSAPELERRRAAEDPGRGAGFPRVMAVARALRGADPELVREVFAAAARAALAHSEVACLAPARLPTLWRGTLRTPRVTRALGEATAPLLLRLLPDGGPDEGVGWLFASSAAERLGDETAAAEFAEHAAGTLLRRPDARADLRLFVGDRDPAAGKDPWSALAARPYLCLARAFEGDPARIAAQLAAARELAGRDAATLDEIERLSED